MKKRLSVRGVDEEVIDILNELRHEQDRFVGRILSDAVWEYWQSYEEEESDLEDVG